MELTIQLPRIEVTCAADVRIRRKTEEVATRGVLHCERLASHSSFPWTVALVNFSVASQDHRFSRLILQPLSLKCAVALNPTCAPPKSASQVFESISNPKRITKESQKNLKRISKESSDDWVRLNWSLKPKSAGLKLMEGIELILIN